MAFYIVTAVTTSNLTCTIYSFYTCDIAQGTEVSSHYISHKIVNPVPTGLKRKTANVHISVVRTWKVSNCSHLGCGIWSFAYSIGGERVWVNGTFTLRNTGFLVFAHNPTLQKLESTTFQKLDLVLSSSEQRWRQPCWAPRRNHSRQSMPPLQTPSQSNFGSRTASAVGANIYGKAGD
jgi:hypothetical protein